MSSVTKYVNEALHEIVKRHGLILDNPESIETARMLLEEHLECALLKVKAEVSDLKRIQQDLEAKTKFNASVIRKNESMIRKNQRIKQSLRYKVAVNTKKPAQTQQPNVEQKDMDEPKEEPMSCQQKPTSKKTKNQGKAHLK